MNLRVVSIRMDVHIMPSNYIAKRRRVQQIQNRTKHGSLRYSIQYIRPGGTRSIHTNKLTSISKIRLKPSHDLPSDTKAKIKPACEEVSHDLLCQKLLTNQEVTKQQCDHDPQPVSRRREPSIGQSLCFAVSFKPIENFH